MSRTRAKKNVIGPGVRMRRIELGWSQSRLAAECQLAGWDITRSIVATVEGQDRWAGDYEMAILASVLGVQIIDLYPRTIDWRSVGLPHVRLWRSRGGVLGGRT